MSVIAITGTARGLRAGDEQRVRRALAECEPLEVRTGGAYDVDSLAAQVAVDLFPYATHTLVLPSAPFNAAALATVLAARYHRVVVAPRRRTDGASYLLRNRILVEPADVLLGFPRGATERQRSGTWATIRYGREQDWTDVRVVPLAKGPVAGMTVARLDASIGWDLRTAMALQRPITLTLSERAVRRRVRGLVTSVAATDAFAVVDGWHVPLEDVWGVHRRRVRWRYSKEEST